MNKNERLLLWTLAAISLVLRALAFFRYRFDADEQHHLHVAWGWTAGMVQYRDYFDNHAPLFHILTAPILAMFGERADILLWMRIPMLFVFAVTIACTYILGRELYDKRIGVWSAVLLSLFPPFFLKSLEYRTDNLWTALWLLALVAFVRGKRAILVGVLLGAALAVSLKTTLLLVTLLITIAIVRCVPLKNIWEALAGFVIVPSALIVYFVNAGAWDELVYCTITFNKNLAQTPYAWIVRVLFVVLLAALVWVARKLRDAMPFWPYFFAIAIAVFTLTLSSFWILISPRDFLPIMPLLAIFAAAGVTRLRHPLAVFTSMAILSIAALWYYADRFENKTDWHITMMHQALRLTRPGEFVMDLKGETIYRPRPFYFAFERITREQMMRGLIRDTVPETVIRTRTHVAQADGPMWPPRARAFLSENFVNLGRLRASGQWLKDDSGTFTIAVPGEYVVLNEHGEARGMLDGSPYRGARALAAGAHRFERAATGESVCVVWAEAYRRGHSPFHLRDREF